MWNELKHEVKMQLLRVVRKLLRRKEKIPVGVYQRSRGEVHPKRRNLNDASWSGVVLDDEVLAKNVSANEEGGNSEQVRDIMLSDEECNSPIFVILFLIIYVYLCILICDYLPFDVFS